MTAELRRRTYLFAKTLLVAALSAASPVIAQTGAQMFFLPPKASVSHSETAVASLAFPSGALSGPGYSASTLVGTGQEAGCRPGDIEIGRQETADEIIVYCSRVSCEQINQRVKSDIDAQRTLLYSMAENNADLKDWAQKNEAAQQAALKTATDALMKSVLAFSAEKVDLRIAQLQNELNRRAAEGQTITTSLEKARAFEHAYARWSGVSDGLKLGMTPGVNAADTWVELQKWSAQAGNEIASLSAAWAAMWSDPELRQILRDEGLDLTFDVLKQGLKPVLTGSFDMAKFLVDYGYNASAWEVSKRNIIERAAQADTNLLAECKLDRLMKIDVRNMNVCNGRLPAPDAPGPEEIRCATAR